MTSKPSPFQFSGPITLDTLDQLFSHHRSLTGGWSMEAGDGDGGGSGDGGQGGGSGDNYKPPATQADLDRIVQQRVARERDKFADYDDLKSKADRLAEIEAANQSENEKAVQAAREEGEKTASQRADARIVQAEAKAAAATAKFRDPADAVAFLDLTKVKVGDDGNVDEAALKAELEDLAKRKPYLVDDGRPNLKPDHSQGGGGGDDKPGSIKQVMAARAAARAEKQPSTSSS